jgi:hypothetical protein
MTCASLPRCWATAEYRSASDPVGRFVTIGEEGETRAVRSNAPSTI